MQFENIILILAEHFDPHEVEAFCIFGNLRLGDEFLRSL